MAAMSVLLMDGQQAVGALGDAFGVHCVAKERGVAGIGKAHDDQAVIGFQDAGGIAAAGVVAVQEGASGNAPGAAGGGRRSGSGCR